MSQAGKPLYLVANWKSHKTLAEAEHFVTEGSTPTENVTQIICPPVPYLASISQLIKSQQLSVSLGVQDVSPYPFGAYTGAVAVDMVKEWVTYAIIGHSERRRYFHESDQEVANKVSRALEAGITPILCVDEPYLESQIGTLDEGLRGTCLFAYEPVSAIGSGHPDTPEHAEAVAQRVQAQVRAEVVVLYGGSVTAENIKSFTDQPHIAGALVGGASLDPQSWHALIKAVAE